MHTTSTMPKWVAAPASRFRGMYNPPHTTKTTPVNFIHRIFISIESLCRKILQDKVQMTSTRGGAAVSWLFASFSKVYLHFLLVSAAMGCTSVGLE